MSTAEMKERISSPRFKARTAAFLWLTTILTGTFALLVYHRLVVADNLAATVSNLSTHAALFRAGVAAAVIGNVCYIAATLLVYAILKSVNRILSLLAAFFSLVGFAGAAFSFALRLVPLAVLAGAHYLNLFNVERVQTLTHMFFRLSAQAGAISFVLFAVHCLLVGHLILKSTTVRFTLAVGGATQPQAR